MGALCLESDSVFRASGVRTAVVAIADRATAVS
jgi:hypothetical protein